MRTNRMNALAIAFSASIILVIGMGFGRFAFTGLYPLMLKEHLLTISSGTYAASANYAGYLLGALMVTRMQPKHSTRVSIYAIVFSMISFFLLSIIHDSAMIILIRGFAGAFSAIAMIASSVWLLNLMKQYHHAPLLYSGVGLGIFISAELIVLGEHLGYSSASIWLLLGIVSCILFFLSAYIQLNAVSTDKPQAQTIQTAAQPVDEKTIIHNPYLLSTIYGLAGLGYIITATYLPAFINHSLGDFNPVHVWALFGLGAIPSCFLWHQLHLKLGNRRGLMLNLIIQGIGVMLPAVYPALMSYFLSALLVGGTFMGTVTIAMSAAYHIAHQVKFNLLAVMTVLYGIGQILGPMIANFIYHQTHHLTLSLIAAGAALFIAAILCLYHSKKPIQA